MDFKIEQLTDKDNETLKSIFLDYQNIGDETFLTKNGKNIISLNQNKKIILNNKMRVRFYEKIKNYNFEEVVNFISILKNEKLNELFEVKNICLNTNCYYFAKDNELYKYNIKNFNTSVCTNLDIKKICEFTFKGSVLTKEDIIFFFKNKINNCIVNEIRNGLYIYKKKNYGNQFLISETKKKELKKINDLITRIEKDNTNLFLTGKDFYEYKTNKNIIKMGDFYFFENYGDVYYEKKDDFFEFFDRGLYFINHKLVIKDKKDYIPLDFVDGKYYFLVSEKYMKEKEKFLNKIVYFEEKENETLSESTSVISFETKIYLRDFIDLFKLEDLLNFSENKEKINKIENLFKENLLLLKEGYTSIKKVFKFGDEDYKILFFNSYYSKEKIFDNSLNIIMYKDKLYLISVNSKFHWINSKENVVELIENNFKEFEMENEKNNFLLNL